MAQLPGRSIPESKHLGFSSSSHFRPLLQSQWPQHANREQHAAQALALSPSHVDGACDLQDGVARTLAQLDARHDGAAEGARGQPREGEVGEHRVGHAEQEEARGGVARPCRSSCCRAAALHSQAAQQGV